MDVVEIKWYEMDMSLNDVKNLLSANIKTMSRSFIAAGYYMKYIRDRELFRDGGYSSILEMGVHHGSRVENNKKYPGSRIFPSIISR